MHETATATTSESVPSSSKPAVAASSLVHRWWASRVGRPFLFEIGLIGTLLFCYKYVRFLARDAGSVAIDNAERVLEVERAFGVAIESQIQSVVLESRGLVELINQYYVASHFAVTIGVMVWLYFFRYSVYRRMRWVMFGITMLALLVHVVFPLAPPRMLDDIGFIDTLKHYGPSIYGPTDEGSANQFAAMPSLHFGYAAMAAWGIIAALKTRWRYLAALHPFAMLVAIVATANHFLLDAIAAGAMLALTGALVWFVVKPLPEDDPDFIEEPDDGTDRELADDPGLELAG
ncbi:MAG: phosphatase PAP2 family protein [Acidimicrobiales bacterium]|nr:phosphatase PAP2 family protein [Acidimicrobiales bacterium]